jgi:hypothetical protein
MDTIFMQVHYLRKPLLEVDEDHCEEATGWLMHCMSEAVKEVTGDPETPVVVEVETRESWGK